jgi:hypothetical protein
MQATYQEDHSEGLFHINYCKNNIILWQNCQFLKINIWLVTSNFFQ